MECPGCGATTPVNRPCRYCRRLNGGAQVPAPQPIGVPEEILEHRGMTAIEWLVFLATLVIMFSIVVPMYLGM